MKTQIDTHGKSVWKSIIWRIIGIFWLASITWLFTHDWIVVSLVTIIHHAVFIVVFYLHERMWEKFWPQKGSVKRRIVKALTYEIGLGNIILGLITYLITGDPVTMTAITLTYTLSKLALYYFYEYIWKH